MFNHVPKMPLLSIKKKEINYLILFYIFLYNFIWFYKFSSFHRHQTNFALQSSNRVNIIIETVIFYVLLPYVFFTFLCCVKFFSGCFRRGFFFIWETKKVVAGCIGWVVNLYSNNCVGICLDGLSIGRLRWVVVL